MTGRLVRAVLAVALLLVVPAVPAAGQTAEGGARLEVDQLSATVRPGGGLAVRGRVVNTGAAPLDDVDVVATLQRRTPTRLDFQQAVDGAVPRRSAVTSATVAVGPIDPGAQAPVEVARTAQELGLGGVDDRLAGVYPLRLQVVAGGEVLDEVRTGVVVLPETVGEPVRTALLVALDNQVALTGTGAVRADPLAGGLAEDARLSRMAAALADGPEVAMTVATSGLVLEAAADAVDGYQVQDAAGTVVIEPGAPETVRAAELLTDVERVLRRGVVEHVALPYASADLVALVRGGQPDAARHAVGYGVLSVASTSGIRPVPGVLSPPDMLDDATLDALAAGLDLVVMDPANLDARTPDAAVLSPPPVRRLRTPAGTTVTAAVTDPWLTPLLSSPAWPEDGPAVAAQRVLAESAALYFEAPFASEPRGLLLAPPQRWDPAPGVLAALLDGLAAAPWVRPVTVPDLAAQLATPEEAISLIYPEAARARELSPEYLAEVGETRQTVASLATVLAAGADPVEPERLVAVAASVDFRGRPQDGLQLLQAVEAAARTVFDGIKVVDSPPFTLTGNGGGQIPVEVRNDGPAPIEVAVRMSSPLRFTVDTPEQRVTLQPAEVARVVFSVRAVTPGVTAPIDVTVTDLEGSRVLDRADVVVRARTSSVAAVVLMMGAGAVLVVWWFRDARKRRQERRSAVPNPA